MNCILLLPIAVSICKDEDAQLSLQTFCISGAGCSD